MDTTTGLPLFLSFITSRLIISEAEALPPPESILKTTALISGSSDAALKSFLKVSDPILPGSYSPSSMIPEAVITAILLSESGISFLQL